MRVQSVRPHHLLWLLLLFAALVVGVFVATVRPAAQGPEAPAQSSDSAAAVPGGN